MVRRVTELPIEAHEHNLDDPRLSLEGIGRFDVVLFLGVFYHLLNPLTVMRELCQLANETIVIETHVEKLGDPRPAMIFYPNDELSNDASNWWGPNTACVVELLKFYGFSNISVQDGSDANRQIFHASR